MDIRSCVDILKTRSVTSHGDACPCCSNSGDNVSNGDNKSIPEPEEMLRYGDHCYQEAIEDLFELQRARVKSYAEFQFQFDEILETMSEEQQGNVNVKISRRIIQIREYLEQQNISGGSSSNTDHDSSATGVVVEDTPVVVSVLSSIVTQQDPNPQMRKNVTSLITLISRLQLLEKEKFTVFASGCLDIFRLKTPHTNAEMIVGSTTLMDAKTSLVHIHQQRLLLEEKISDELVELQELKADFVPLL